MPLNSVYWNVNFLIALTVVFFLYVLIEGITSPEPEPSEDEELY
ncbi:MULTISPECIES: hypothetical protein [Paenibacillus]|nr:hypothetical protein [Paenibacillus caseinilyticus]MCZ8522656.1 hypothetical protein [Paenibacillus caseinilyticus]